MSNAIEIDRVGKLYRLGQIGSGTLSSDLGRMWARLLGRPDPLAAIGVENDRENLDAASVWAVKDVSLAIERGTVLGIVGRNGAGKSTLLKMLSRITAPTTGRIRMKGRIASLLEVGTGFHLELTGRENVYLNGAILGMSRREVTQQLEAIVEFSGCAGYLDTPVKRYSSGMMVRLGFAVAAHLECEILVVDEVLAVGDIEFQRRCIGRMKDVAKSGRTVLFVSHNMGSIETLCTHAITIRNGRLVDIGHPSNVIQNYLDSQSELAQRQLSEQATQYIKSFKISDSSGKARNQFLVGETVVFDAELSANPPLTDPRFGFIISKRGIGRIATLHTDVQNTSRWTVNERTHVRAIWKNSPLNMGKYTVDVSLWCFDKELETLLGCGELTFEMRDVYGTGMLPDPPTQGHLLTDTTWMIDDGVVRPRRSETKSTRKLF